MPLKQLLLALLPALVCACASAPPPAAGVATAVDDASVDRTLLAAGYHAETQKGVIVYCRNEVSTGSIMAKKVCRSAEAARNQSLSAPEEEALRARRARMTN